MTFTFDDIESIALGRTDPPSDSIPQGVPGDELERIQRWRAANRGSFAAKQADGEVELSIIGVIGGGWLGDGISARSVKRWADENKDAKSIRVLVDSPGGDYFDGVAIMNILKRHAANVTIEVIGEAASAASVIAMAGDTIEMHTGTDMMVHRAWTIALGNGDDMRTAAQQLDVIDDSLGSIYAARTNKPRAEIDKLVAATTHMSAAKAVAEGFADREVPAKQKSDPSAGTKATGARAQAQTLPAAPSAAPETQTQPAPEDRQPSPARNLGEEQENMALPKNIITALALADDADETAAVQAIGKLKASASIGLQIETQLGVQGAAAVGAVKALQDEREKNKELFGEVAKLKIVNARREFDSLIDKGKNVTKNLTPKGVGDYTSKFDAAAKVAETDPEQGANDAAAVCESLRGYLAIAPRYTIEARQPAFDGDVGSVTHDGKKFEELKPMQQKALKDANPEKYAFMRQDAQARGAI